MFTVLHNQSLTLFSSHQECHEQMAAIGNVLSKDAILNELRYGIKIHIENLFNPAMI